MNAERLFDEVHLLALHYHWAERDILALTAARRGRYLQRLLRDRAADSR